MQNALARLSILCVSAFSLAQAIALPPERTLDVDVVELIEGREVAGSTDFVIEHEGIEYRFASQKTKETFSKDPAKYAVADGGACGRMGPLAGLGDARRRSVHVGRVYFFASDGCRENFLKSPESYIESADEKIFGSHEQVLAGRATLDKVVAWSGGEDHLRELTAYRASAARKEMQGGKEWSITNETVIIPCELLSETSMERFLVFDHLHFKLWSDGFNQRRGTNRNQQGTCVPPHNGSLACRDSQGARRQVSSGRLPWAYRHRRRRRQTWRH